MLSNATSWFSIWTSGLPDLSDSNELNDFLTWMDWPGFVSGSPHNSNGVIEEYINTTTYKLPTNPPVDVPIGTVTGNTWFVWLVPHSEINSGTQVYSQIGINYNGDDASLYQTNTSINLRSYDVTYTGSNWENDTYRVFTGPLNLGWNIGSVNTPNSDIIYFGGGTLSNT
jgi:hypothetical protein